MTGTDQAAKVMNSWAEQVRRSKILHFVASTRITFDLGAGVLPLSLNLGPIRVEAWSQGPQWRLEGAYGGRKYVGVLPEASDHMYLLSPDGRWTRKKALARPDDMKLKWFGLDLLDTVTYVSVEDGIWRGQPVWVVEGFGATGDRCVWWVGRDDPRVRKFEHGGGYLELEVRGERKRAPLPGARVAEFEVVEFPVDLPSELFAAPPDAPLEETITEKFLEWFDQWVTG